MIQQSHFWETEQTYWNQDRKEIICTPMFNAASFTITKIRKPPKCPSVDEQVKKTQHQRTMEYYSALNKGSSAICDNMEEPGILCWMK